MFDRFVLSVSVALAALAAVSATVPTARAQDAGEKSGGEEAPSEKKPAAKKQEPKEAVQPIQLVFNNGTWVIRDPWADKATQTAQAKIYEMGTVNIPLKNVMRYQKVGTGWAKETQPLAAVQSIVWPKDPAPIAAASLEILRGNATKALTLIEPVLSFFGAMNKRAPGSLWLKAASIKLDALVLQKNDMLITTFIRELRAAGPETIPGLPDKIRFAELDIVYRRAMKNKSNAELEDAIRQTNEFIKDATDVETLAKLHILKGDALLTLRQYDDVYDKKGKIQKEGALNAFFRVNIFYGNQTKYVPIATLGAVKALLAMDKPSKEVQALQLKDVAKRYLNELRDKFPESKEAKEATTLINKLRTKEEIEAEAKKKAAEAEQATTIGEGGAAGEGSAGSSGGGE